MRVASSLHSRATLKSRDWKKVGRSGIPPLGSYTSFTCECSSCKDVLKHTAHWTELQKDTHFKVQSNVRLGDRVIVQGRYSGTVRYVGDLDSSFTNDQIYIGVKTDDPVGESDGLYNGRRFFKCPPKHGLFVPINEAAYIPIPGKNYAKRLIGHHPASTPTLSNRCYEQRLLKQAEKLLPKPSSLSLKKSTVDNGPSSSDNDVAEVCLSHQSLTSERSTVNADQSFLSTDVEISSVPANTPNVTPTNSKTFQRCKELTCYTGSSLFHSRKYEINPSGDSSEILQPNDAYVSSWMEYVTTIKNSPNTRRLFISSPHSKERNEDDKISLTDLEVMKPKPSYTNRLLSGLPNESVLASALISPECKLKDLEEFEYWMKHWGGGKKGWIMAQTRQRLKDAQRLGTRQTEWQQTIDELEDKEEFSPQIERIKFLQEELIQIRSTNQKLIDRTSLTRYGSLSEKTIAHCQRQIENEQKRIEELEVSIAKNPLSSIIDMTQLK